MTAACGRCRPCDASRCDGETIGGRGHCMYVSGGVERDDKLNGTS